MTMVHESQNTVVTNVRRVERGRGLTRGGEVEISQLAAQDMRSRVSASAEEVLGKKGGISNPDGVLSADQLWEAFRTCADLRSGMEFLARRASTQAWEVVPTVESDSDDYDTAQLQCRAVTRMLKGPNADDAWQGFTYQLVLDALIYWHAAAELVFEDVGGRNGAKRAGPIQEIVPIYGPSIHPIVEGGRITGWTQRVASGEDRKLDRSQVVRLCLSPNTRSKYGLPIIETIVMEITTLCRMSARTMREANDQEIPEGWLVLTGVHKATIDSVKESARNRKGNPNKLAIIHAPGATSPAHWLRATPSTREIEYLPITKEARRTIWRILGVSPVSQGDTTDANRADADAMLLTDETGVYGPMLSILEGMVNNRILPSIVDRVSGAAGAPVLCAFGFDRTRELTPSEDLDAAKADDIRLKNGSIKLNEVRVRDGRPTYGVYGEIPRINGVPIDADGQPDPETLDEVGEEVSDLPDEAEENPNEELSRRHMHGAACRSLPSAWQDPDTFPDGVRTLDLVKLASEVEAYANRIAPRWESVKNDVLAITTAEFEAGTVGDDRHVRRVRTAISRLRQTWSALSLQSYRATARDAVRRAHGFSPGTITLDPDLAARRYHDQAMEYLDQLMDDVSNRALANIAAARSMARAKTDAESNVASGAALAVLLAAVAKSFDAAKHRIDNWSGKLVDLAWEVFGSAMAEGGTGTEGEEWWVIWEDVGDLRECTDCEEQGGYPARPLSALPYMPGGATQCRGRCRCVLTMWTRAEVMDGTAVRYAR